MVGNFHQSANMVNRVYFFRYNLIRPCPVIDLTLEDPIWFYNRLRDFIRGNVEEVINHHQLNHLLRIHRSEIPHGTVIFNGRLVWWWTRVFSRWIEKRHSERTFVRCRMMSCSTGWFIQSRDDRGGCGVFVEDVSGPRRTLLLLLAAG